MTVKLLIIIGNVTERFVEEQSKIRLAQSWEGVSISFFCSMLSAKIQ